MSTDREQHYEQALKVARAATDYVGRPSSRFGEQALYDRLTDEVRAFRRLEHELATGP